jgi:hypothetical protein
MTIDEKHLLNWMALRIIITQGGADDTDRDISDQVARAVRFINKKLPDHVPVPRYEDPLVLKSGELEQISKAYNAFWARRKKKNGWRKIRLKGSLY